MQAFIKIKGTDKSALIDWASFDYEQNKDHKTDLLKFSIKNYGTKTYVPDIVDEVELYIGDTLGTAIKQFGGHIITIEDQASGPGMIIYDIVARDYSFKMDSKLVVKEYSGQTVAQIVADIQSTVLPAGYTANSVTAPATVNLIKFNYEYPSKCFDQLAELFGYTWWVDETKDIHFVSRSNYAAPFNLTDSNDTYIFESLKRKRNADQIRNSIFIRGDEFLSTGTQSEKIGKQADGTNKIFKLAYRYKNYVLKINSVTKTVGVDNIDDAASFDALYNFEEKALKFKVAPAGTDDVDFSGNFYIPLRIKWRDNASISKYGSEFQFLIIDTTLKSDVSAKDRAKAEIMAYSDQMNEASFQTRKDGLKAGQVINVQSTLRGMNETYVISRVVARCEGGQKLIYDVQLTTTKTMDMIDLLQNLLTAKNKEISITSDEQLVQVDGFIEEIKWGESWNAQVRPRATPNFAEVIHFSDSVRINPWGVNTLPIWVAGPYYPADGSDRNRVPNADSGALAA